MLDPPGTSRLFTSPATTSVATTTVPLLPHSCSAWWVSSRLDIDACDWSQQERNHAQQRPAYAEAIR